MGFVVAAPDYRLSAEAHFPAQIDHLVAALRWLHNTPASWGSCPAAPT
jgi:acetyl esterase/lipase